GTASSYRCSAARRPRGRSRCGHSSASGFTRLKSPGTSLPKMGVVSNLMTLVLILIAGLMGASGGVLSAAAAHGKSGMGLDGGGYLLLFHAVAVLSGVALLQQGLLLRPLVLGVVSGWVLGSALFAGDIALRAFVYRLFPMAAPTGGVVLILAWLALAVAAILALLHS